MKKLICLLVNYKKFIEDQLQLGQKKYIVKIFLNYIIKGIKIMSENTQIKDLSLKKKN